MKQYNFKEEWYFIRQDLVSYIIPTILYLLLNSIKNFSFQTFLYASFECLLFYVAFWFIRINFDLTYHSDSWRHCKFWTRTMLCLGVFVLWILPIRYTIINSFVVASICCIVLYLVAVETNEKKSLLNKINKNLYAMNEQELFEYCKRKGLCDFDIKMADVIFRQQLKGKELYEKLGYSKRQTLRIKKKLQVKLTTE